MKDISEIDSNFKINSTLGLENITYHDVTKEPFRIYGLLHDKIYRRIPEKIAQSIGEQIYQLHKCTAGGRLKFTTDSTRIVINCKMEDITHFPHMPLTGTSGFDFIVDGISRAGVSPGYFDVGGFEAVKNVGDNKKMHDIEINFPLYNDVRELYIGLDSDAAVEKSKGYAYDELPIVFYGSSITQGGCVSVPSVAYPSLVAKHFGMDHINLGFSGNAKGETEMAEYIAGLPMKIFALDYDHNSSGPEHLMQTHERFYKIVREKNPALPIIITTSPDLNFRVDSVRDLWKRRRDVIYKTYENAIANGDKNVYFIDGIDFYGDYKWWWSSVDGVHPNDIGHYRIAEKYIKVIEKILK